ncbi:MAG TPA: DUF5916 domain-containing protein [Flavisolibacter sp.]|nr:DUF5916 domain-containing protein [Flavisolibacter sp.]
MRSIFCLALLLHAVILFAQKKNASFELRIHRTSSEIKVDGVSDEACWSEATTAGDFFMVLPMDTSRARVRTDVKMCYDGHHVYLLAICYSSAKDMVESLRRDFAFQKNDNFLVFIDPFQDGTNGFSFGANAAGAQWDGLMYEGGKVDLSWDNKWSSAVRRYPDRWVLEMAIPFKTLRYRKNTSNWGINFSRNDLNTTEKSSWAPVPRQFPTASLAYTGNLIWDEPPPAPGLNVSLIPYLLGGGTREYIPQSVKSTRHEAGIDAKIAITPSLNLDLTYNPEFSQVEVDRQVTNLSRYELFFPEKRQFFLENGDQFNNFGYPSIRPFFSRRIGLNVPIEFGVRLSGKLGRDWRIGAMDMQTKRRDEIGLPQQNFSVLALQRRIFSRSNIGFIMINKQSVNYHPKDSSLPFYSLYNRNVGVEYNLASATNLWTGKALVLKSFSPASPASGKDITHAAHLQYAAKKWLALAAYEFVGVHYTSEVGYVPRKGYIKVNPQLAYTMFPKGGAVLTHGPQLASTYFFTPSWHATDNQSIFNYLITFRTKATLAAVAQHDFIRLLFPFDPTNTGKDSLAAGSEHRWKTGGIDFVSKPQSVLTYDVSLRYGGYYAHGERLTVANNIGYRFQPYVNVLLSTSFNQLQLPQPWGRKRFWLIGPKIDVTFTNTLFLTTYIQYNEQQKNTNINVRLQWRYRPASDLFVVYTDNYLNLPFSIRNRAFVIKLNYWWSV